MACKLSIYLGVQQKKELRSMCLSLRSSIGSVESRLIGTRMVVVDMDLVKVGFVLCRGFGGFVCNISPGDIFFFCIVTCDVEN